MQDKKMKIVFLSYLHGFGGAEKQNIMLANAMVNKGHDVTLVSIYADNICYNLDKRIKYIFMPDRMGGPMRLFSRYIGIINVLRDIKPDITVNFWFQSAYMTAIMKKSITGKVIYSERGDPGDKEYNGLLGLIRKITLPRIDGFIFQSNGAKNFFDKQVQMRSVVIPNPVFIKKKDFPKVKKRRKAIVTIGRLHPQKNQELLIDSFTKISEKFPEYVLEIYGDGELKETLEQKISVLNMTDKILLKGTSKRVHDFLYDASLFVLSSDYEGLPNTLIEAMALGVPCISTDCKPGGARDIIRTGINVVIVPCGNQECLSKAMEQLLSNVDLRDKLGNEATKIIDKLNPNNVYNSWENYFVSIMHTHL